MACVSDDFKFLAEGASEARSASSSSRSAATLVSISDSSTLLTEKKETRKLISDSNKHESETRIFGRETKCQTYSSSSSFNCNSKHLTSTFRFRSCSKIASSGSLCLGGAMSHAAARSAAVSCVRRTDRLRWT